MISVIYVQLDYFITERLFYFNFLFANLIFIIFIDSLVNIFQLFNFYPFVKFLHLFISLLFKLLFISQNILIFFSSKMLL